MGRQRKMTEWIKKKDIRFIHCMYALFPSSYSSYHPLLTPHWS